MRGHIVSAALLLGCSLLAGCGQKGPLVLPPPNPAVATPAAAPVAPAAPAAATTAAQPAPGTSSGLPPRA